MIPGPFVILQHLLPHHGLTWLTGRITRWRWLQPLLINWFIRRYQVDLGEAELEERGDYDSFHKLFTRALKPTARPLPGDPEILVAPADGRFSELGDIEDGRLLQAKGISYELGDLLGDDSALAKHFIGGKFATIYLAPRDYHRVHMPISGTLLETRYIPGRLFSVNPVTTRQVPSLFCRNERLVCLFDTAIGRVAVILVGAMIVGGIETVWKPAGYAAGKADRLQPDSSREPIRLSRGEELGRFRFGSTVIVLLPPDTVRLHSGLEAEDRILMGEALAVMI